MIEFADPCISFNVKKTVRVKGRKLMTAEMKGLLVLADLFGHLVGVTSDASFEVSEPIASSESIQVLFNLTRRQEF